MSGAPTTDACSEAVGADDGPPSPSHADVDAIVLAGGSGVRMGRQINKVYLEVDGSPIITRPLKVLAAHPAIRSIWLVVRPTDLAYARRLVVGLALPGLRGPVAGGATRPDSERAGLGALGPGARYVLIHDGARPALTPDLLTRLCAAARRVGGAVPVVPCATGPRDGPVRVTPDGFAAPADMQRLRRVQTPQVFAREPLLRAYSCAAAAGFAGLDTADTVQNFTDLPIAAVPGDPDNVKVTYPADLDRVAPLLR